MEGVGGRLGRSSSRYGTNTVFTGPVRKWKKHWVPIIPPPNPNPNPNPNSNSTTSSSTLNANNPTVSHLRLFKWTPLSNIKPNPNSNQHTSPTPRHHSPSQKKFKYIPIAVLEEQNKEAEDNSDNEDELADTDENTTEETIKSDGREEKPDINDMPMEENQEGSEDNDTAPGRQDLNESLDLSLGLTSHEEELNSNS